MDSNNEIMKCIDRIGQLYDIDERVLKITRYYSDEKSFDDGAIEDEKADMRHQMWITIAGDETDPTTKLYIVWQDRTTVDYEIWDNNHIFTCELHILKSKLIEIVRDYHITKYPLWFNTWKGSRWI